MDPRIELRHLRYFLAVAEKLHFGRAATRLHIAQPALSQQIRQLEALLGAPLLRRTSRVVELTAAGRAFRPRARDLLGRLSEDLDEARRVARGESGRLDIAFVSSASSTIGGLLRRVTDERPDVLVRLHEGFTRTVVDRLEKGVADVGIVRDAEDRPGLALTTLFEEGFAAVLPVGHELAARRRVHAAQLSAWPLVLFPPSAGTEAFARNMQPFHEAGVEPAIAFHASEWNTILHLVAHGLGVTIAPLSAAAPLPAGAVAVPLAGTDARSRMQIAHRAGDDNPLVSAIAALARNAAKTQD
ncbi:LysR substrate-binding domain-containing protein [Microbacterium sp. 13-71-7]|uniref:LysR family transcriptional regulator n=1 Tax=Microbacterium sp. 13-71-7 TaxID=1970399 RepID=UPI000BD5BE78|nr:LysR substrate-binding domain-containing protein [Microbacterium sp. 13-71-7]OZB86064.1 MAG: LysR family transcriptional regulator [Microbacterium sp. 13-71-7]